MRGIRDEDNDEAGFLVSDDACVIGSTDKAIKVDLGEHPHTFLDPTLWLPKSAIADTSEVFDPKSKERGKLVVQSWFASRSGWLDGESSVKKTKSWFGVPVPEKR